MYGAHLRIAYTKGKEEKNIKAKLKRYMCHNKVELSCYCTCGPIIVDILTGCL